VLKNLILGVTNQQDVLNYYNAALLFKDLPSEVNGYVFNYRGINCIIINKNLSYYKKKKTLLHELAHIELNQLCQLDKDLFAFYIDKYEDEANEYIKEIMKGSD
jgi:Zn-dependent peptidase ImmA (M78 family)